MRSILIYIVLFLHFHLFNLHSQDSDSPFSVSGVFPSLTMTANHFQWTEAGIGALLSWADRLWVITWWGVLMMNWKNRVTGLRPF